MSLMALASTPGCRYSRRRRACATKAKAAMPLGLGGAAGGPEAAAARRCCPGTLDDVGAAGALASPPKLEAELASAPLRRVLSRSTSQSCRNLATNGSEHAASGSQMSWASLASTPKKSPTSAAPAAAAEQLQRSSAAAAAAAPPRSCGRSSLAPVAGLDVDAACCEGVAAGGVFLNFAVSCKFSRAQLYQRACFQSKALPINTYLLTSLK